MGNQLDKGIVAGIASASEDEIKETLACLEKQNVAKLRASMGYTVYYHTACEKFWGRAYAPCLILKHAGANFETKTPDQVPSDAGIFAVPVVKLASGGYVSQAAGIMCSLGAELCVWPDGGAFQEAKALQLAADGADFTGDVYGGKPADRIKKWLDHFEANLAKQGGMMVGKKLTYTDFVLMTPITNMQEKNIMNLSAHPKLSAWFKGMSDLPAVKWAASKGLKVFP